jgi:hypothetical protein
VVQHRDSRVGGRQPIGGGGGRPKQHARQQAHSPGVVPGARWRVRRRVAQQHICEQPCPGAL